MLDIPSQPAPRDCFARPQQHMEAMTPGLQRVAKRRMEVHHASLTDTDNDGLMQADARAVRSKFGAREKEV